MSERVAAGERLPFFSCPGAPVELRREVGGWLPAERLGLSPDGRAYVHFPGGESIDGMFAATVKSGDWRIRKTETASNP